MGAALIAGCFLLAGAGRGHCGFVHKGAALHLWTLWTMGFKFVQTVHKYFGLNWRRARKSRINVDTLDTLDNLF
jgi:hypothetical protein